MNLTMLSYGKTSNGVQAQGREKYTIGKKNKKNEPVSSFLIWIK